MSSLNRFSVKSSIGSSCLWLGLCVGAVSFFAEPIAQVGANGRLPDGVNVKAQGADYILFPTTFGLLVSPDDGENFEWICESNIGYGGSFDPDYAVGANGDIWATTFQGLRRTTDGGCTWASIGGELENRFFSDVEIGSDGRIWAAAASGTADSINDVFVSADNGVTFTSVGLPDPDIIYRSIRIAPSDPNFVMVTGFKPSTPDGNGGMNPPEALIRRSIDGGANWEPPLSVTDFVFGNSPNLFLLGISPDDSNAVFIKVFGARSPKGDDVYRSTNGGANFEKILEFQDNIKAFVIRADTAEVETAADDRIIVGTRANCIGDPSDLEKGCVRVSTDGGATFVPAATEPKMGCITERDSGELLSCGANWTPDNFALARSDDGDDWSKIVRFSELGGPKDCPEESPQFRCNVNDWPMLCLQLGICADVDAGVTELDGGQGDGGPPPSDGGCGCSASGGMGLGAFLFIPFVFALRRRRR